jgi:hypothetical protein
MLTNTTATLEELQELVTAGTHITLSRRMPESTRPGTFSGVLKQASGPFPPYGFAVLWHGDQGEQSYLALPPDWEWSIERTEHRHTDLQEHAHDYIQGSRVLIHRHAS